MAVTGNKYTVPFVDNQLVKYTLNTMYTTHILISII